MPASYHDHQHLSLSLLTFNLYLEFFKSETTAGSQLHVVTDSRATNSRTQKTVNGSRSNATSLLNTRDSSRLLTAGLIKPSLNTAVPLLTEVLVGQLVVVVRCQTFL